MRPADTCEELRARTKRLADMYEHLNALHEELRMITEMVQEQTRQLHAQLRQARRSRNAKVVRSKP